MKEGEDSSIEIFFDFNDIGDHTTEARKLLKDTVGSMLSKRVENNSVYTDDAFKILQIAESLNNAEAVVAIDEYLKSQDAILQLVRGRNDEADIEHLGNCNMLQ